MYNFDFLLFAVRQGQAQLLLTTRSSKPW